MIQSRVLPFVVACVASLGVACTAGVGPEGRENSEQEASAMTAADLSGLVACDVTHDEAKCFVDASFPVQGWYSLATRLEDGTAGPPMIAKAEVVGPKEALGIPIRLYGGAFDGVYSWKPAAKSKPGSGGGLSTKTLPAAFVRYCTFTRCKYIVVGKEGPPPQ